MQRFVLILTPLLAFLQTLLTRVGLRPPRLLDSPQAKGKRSSRDASKREFMATYGASNGELFTQQQLSILVDRLDGIKRSLDKTSTGHYNRRLTALDIANPAPLGFFGFSLAVALYMSQTAEITEQSTKFLAFPLGIFYGGLLMVLTSMWEVLRRNALGAAAFGVYGGFWIAVGVYGILQAQGVFFLEAVDGMKAVFVLFGIAAVCFAVISLAICLMLPFMFINLAIMFFLLAGGVENHTANKVGGWWGIITSGIALYLGMAFLFEDVWGKEILPVFYTKPYRKHAVVLWPRISLHDTMDTTAGYPKPGPFIAPGESDERRYRTASLETTPTTSVTALEHKVSDNMV